MTRRTFPTRIWFASLTCRCLLGSPFIFFPFVFIFLLSSVHFPFSSFYFLSFSFMSFFCSFHLPFITFHFLFFSFRFPFISASCSFHFPYSACSSHFPCMFPSCSSHVILICLTYSFHVSFNVPFIFRSLSYPFSLISMPAFGWNEAITPINVVLWSMF